MTRKITFCAMLSVMGVLCLLAANILQTNTVFFYLFSTMFCYVATEECGIRYGLLTYIAVSVLGFLLVANKVSMLAYAIVDGYYPVIKHIVEHWNLPKLGKWAGKLVFAAGISLIAYVMMRNLLTVGIALPVLFLAGIVVFVLYDIALTVGIRFYVLRLRKWKP